MLKTSKHHTNVSLKEILDFITWLKKIALQYPEIRQVFLFGSFARGDASTTSDIDLAFSLSDSSKWSVIAQDIRETAKTLKKLDLVCFEKISGDFRKKVLKEGSVIYENREGATKSSKF